LEWPFRSNQEYFEVLEHFALQLEHGGRVAEAGDLRSGLGMLNGLTDGWAQLLESIEKVHRACASELPVVQRATLENLRKGAMAAVYRR
jgi:hypothetical protein